MGHVRVGTYKDGSKELDVKQDGGLTVIECEGGKWVFNENGFNVQPAPPAPPPAKKASLGVAAKKNGDDPELD